MKPGSSESTNGRASSVMRAEAVVVSSESGIKSLICPVCEPVDLRDRRDVSCEADRRCLEVCFGGTGMEVR
jgi:hypothetical protein